MGFFMAIYIVGVVWKFLTHSAMRLYLKYIWNRKNFMSFIEINKKSSEQEPRSACYPAVANTHEPAATFFNPLLMTP
jgi:hypothetical protein